MDHARTQHPNAVLTPKGRRKMVDCVVERGWTIEATAERFQVDAKTVRKWRTGSSNRATPGCRIGHRGHIGPRTARPARAGVG